LLEYFGAEDRQIVKKMAIPPEDAPKLTGHGENDAGSREYLGGSTGVMREHLNLCPIYSRFVEQAPLGTVRIDSKLPKI